MPDTPSDFYAFSQHSSVMRREWPGLISRISRNREEESFRGSSVRGRVLPRRCQPEYRANGVDKSLGGPAGRKGDTLGMSLDVPPR